MVRFLLKSILLLAMWCLPIFAKVYDLRRDPIDVVIPCGPNDRLIIDRCIDHVRAYVKNVNRIIVISPKKYTNKAEWVNERDYPFAELYLSKKSPFYPLIHHSTTWLFQQLLKLYAFEMIPNLSSNILVLDADTFFLQPIELINERGEPFFNVGVQCNEKYFNMGKKLIPQFQRVHAEYSGICNYMVFQRPVVEELLRTVRDLHNCEFYEVLAKCYDPKYCPDWAQNLSEEERNACHFSEYELYFNYFLKNSDQGHIRYLLWDDVPNCDKKSLKGYANKGYSHVSAHHWMRKKF